jgi:hypothetical protein
MEFLGQLIATVRDNPMEVAICVAFPVVLIVLFGGKGPDAGSGGSGDGDCGD